MLNAALGFMRTILRFPPLWLAWIGLLMGANMVAPLFFLPSPEAVWTLAVFMAAATTQMLMFSRLGFVRLLGVAHFLWFPLVVWIWIRMDGLPTGDPMYMWMACLVALNSVSLAVDVADVGRYLVGERAPTLTLEDPV